MDIKEVRRKFGDWWIRISRPPRQVSVANGFSEWAQEDPTVTAVGIHRTTAEQVKAEGMSQAEALDGLATALTKWEEASNAPK